MQAKQRPAKLIIWLCAALALLATTPHPKLIAQVACNRLQSIHYDHRTGIDYYSALARLPADTDEGVANLKQLLQQGAGAKAPPAGAEPLAALRGAHTIQTAAGAPVRSRTAKQLASLGPAEPPGVCLTPGCVKAAAEIIKNIDDRVDPCEDFYRYSCGNWIDSQVIPEDKTSVSLFSVVQDELDGKLRNLIEREPAPDDPPIVGRMRNLYESCMNTSK